MQRTHGHLLRRIALSVALTVALVTGTGVVTAANPHTGGTAGQPNKSCQAFSPVPPLLVPGFNTAGFNNVATAHYAGSQPQNSNNPQSVSQYDVACFQQSTH
jgi:hypothetical protein